MTLEQLRIFVAVAECQHMTRAAALLNRTQSAVSASICALEERHDVKLFHRVGRHIELTETGRQFLPEARAVLDRAQLAEASLQEKGTSLRGTLRLHASQTVASYWLPPHLAKLHEAHPALSIITHAGNSSEVAEAVREGRADLGVIETDISDDEFKSKVVGLDNLVIAVAPDHFLAECKRLTVEDLKNTSWVLREIGSGTRAVSEHILHDYGLAVTQLDIALELPSNEAMLAVVSSGVAACIISRLAAEPALNAGHISVIDLDKGQRPFTALTHRQRQASAAVDALLDLIETEQG